MGVAFSHWNERGRKKGDKMKEGGMLIYKVGLVGPTI